MSFGKKQSLQKTREPYGKVTEVGQVPIALHEIAELSRPPSRFNEIERLVMIRNLIDSVIAVTCANPGCLSQMAEGLPHRELEMVASGSLRPNFDSPTCIEESFICHGCDAVIEIDGSIPSKRVFEWIEERTGEKHPYCFDCDDILIQDGELPDAKKKREARLTAI